MILQDLACIQESYPSQTMRPVKRASDPVSMLQVAAKQEESFAELLLVRRVPAAYRQCLAECMRRYLSQLLQHRTNTCLGGGICLALHTACEGICLAWT